MTDVARTIVNLTGWTGGPGVNVVHWCSPGHVDIGEEDVDNFHDALNDAFTLMNTGIVNQCTWTIDPNVDVIDDGTGELLYGVTQTTTTFAGTGTGSGTSLSRANQVLVKFGTSDVYDGKRIRGRMFIGPCDDAVFTTTGQITGAVLSAWPGYFDALTDPLGARLIVWHRPIYTRVGGVRTLTREGKYADVQSVSIGTKPASLRSRRD